MRDTVRRGLGLACVALSLFLAVLGAGLKYWATDRIAVLPLNFYAKISMTGQTTYLDLQTLTEKKSQASVVETFRGDVGESTDRILVVDVSNVVSSTSGEFIGATVERAGIDRSTGEFVNCCGETVDGKPAVHQGFAFKFPFNTPKHDLPLWDSTDLKSYPGRFQGEDTIAGHRVYKFVSTVPPHVVRTLPAVGALVGEDPSSDVPIYNSTVRTYWVEPITGLPLAAGVKITTTLRNSRGQDKVTIFSGSIATDNANPDPDTLALLNREMHEITLINRLTPLLWGVGVLLAIAGVALLRRNRPQGVTPGAATPVEPHEPAQLEWHPSPTTPPAGRHRKPDQDEPPDPQTTALARPVSSARRPPISGASLTRQAGRTRQYADDQPPEYDPPPPIAPPRPREHDSRP